MVSENKRIARNAIMLYIRMLLSMFVGLYTSRVVLQVLGVEDYGVYGLVGSVVSMMGFINASMSGATSRFITYELGRGDKKSLNETFCSALIVHFLIALFIILIGETIGLWFLCNKLVIPDGRMTAAHWVFHLSLMSAAIGITQPPYSACMMAHEKMDIYAYFDLLHVTLKLLIVFLLSCSWFDKLIFYAFLEVSVSILMLAIYRIYCLRHFEESHFRWVWNKLQFKSMLSFSGWDLYGNLSFSLVQHGRNFIINIFFGVILNAACGIATTVQGTIQRFSNNIKGAFSPQIIKSYASHNFQRMQFLIIEGSKYSYLFLMIVSVPIAIEIHFVINLWLGQIPVYVPSFCRILLIQNAFITLNAYLIIAIHATGRVKRFFYTGSLSLCQLPVLYFLFSYYHLNPDWIYYVSFFFSFLSMFVYIGIVRIQIPELDVWIVFFKWLKPVLVSLICFLPLIILHNNIDSGFIRFFLIFFSYFLMLSISTFCFLRDRHQRTIAIKKIKNGITGVKSVFS